MKGTKLYIIAGIILLLLLGFSIKTKTKLDWSENYTAESKIPYGSKIIFDALQATYQGQVILLTNEMKLFSRIDEEKQCYLAITDEYDPSQSFLDSLLSFVRKGNTAFIAARKLGGLQKQLNLKIDSSYAPPLMYVTLRADSIGVKSQYTLRSIGSYSTSFAHFSPDSCDALGRQYKDSVNFIRAHYGEGEFYICLVPDAFTNYTILQSENRDYIWRVLKELPPSTTLFWDEIHKPQSIYQGSPLQFVLSNGALKKAYYLMLASVVLLLIFYSKRKQRVIPTILPVKNNSLEFAQTLTGLYYNQQQHTKMAKMKIQYFLEAVWSKYYIRPEEFWVMEAEKFALRTGVELSEIRELLFCLNYYRNKTYIELSDLTEINKQIENFYKKS
ncbi:MAG: DUF4350 domain-containing protein [Ignavibacteria bacterium]|nr:DUF4350 domain-containing protein [Ignavibacteria bacterium]